MRHSATFTQIRQMNSNTCEYRYMRGEHRGEKCPNPIVIREKVCQVCIFKMSCKELVSEKFLGYIKDLGLTKANNGFFFSMKYGFVLEYDGEMNLKGMAEQVVEEKGPLFTSKLEARETTKEDKKLAVSLGIKVELSRTEYLGKLMDIQTQIITEVKKEQQKLISIILEKTDVKSRLRSIRQILLELKVEKKEDQTISPDLNLSYSAIFSKIPDLSIDQMEDLTNTFTNIFEPQVKHRKLMNKIGEVIRSSDVSDEEKIDKISDLLI